MKNILGLDLGTTSIGWAVINTDESDNKNSSIVAVGSRIIPLTSDENNQFSKGQAISKNAERTKNRTKRKGYDRYQLRRALLIEKLTQLEMYDGSPLQLTVLELWGLRAKAPKEKISLKELGRVLCHINQKRGYKCAKSDFEDKKLGDYVKQVVERYKTLHENNLTVGQYLYNALCEDSAFRCKGHIFPRDAYVEEYDRIMECQSAFYPKILTNEVIEHIRNYIIFHQRPLKSCKHLVGRCELEKREILVNGKIVNCAPKVTPRSSPLFQICKIWEAINNINIQNKKGDTLHITLEEKQEIFKLMNTRERLRVGDLKLALRIKGNEWLFGKVPSSMLQGNTTYCLIQKALGKHYTHLLAFNTKVIDSDYVDTETGEYRKVISSDFEKEPLYRLWHTLYSISDINELKNALRKSFSIQDENVLEALCKIDFVKSGYSNKSSRAIRKILPYLQTGNNYYDSKMAAGYNDSILTKEANETRVLLDKIPQIQKGELRQPVVEKILNQLARVVNVLMDNYGRFDEIRIELARELKQSKKERESTTKNINKNQKENDEIAKRIFSEYHLTPTKSKIQKYKMWEESQHICMYCGSPVNVKEFLNGIEAEIEHIIPRSLLFDNSFSNKVCACRNCNREKNNQTAYDYMKMKGDGEFNAYLDRVNQLYEEKKISKTKRNNLLLTSANIPTDFIDRQLRESQYIAKKAKELLLSVCYNVYSTSGSITDYIRHMWGWDEVLHNLNIDKYKKGGLVGDDGHIEGWSKRMDHRHHAIDALTIACTKQGYIQRFNNLSGQKEEAFKPLDSTEQGSDTVEKFTSLEKFIKNQPHFSTSEVKCAIERILISYKSGKKVATKSKRYIYKNGKRICLQNGIITPRGPLCEEKVYGRIYSNKTKNYEYVIKYSIGSIKKDDVKSIVDEKIREIVANRLKEYNGDNKKAFATPLYDTQNRVINSVRCFTGLKNNSVATLRNNTNGEAISFAKFGNNHHVAIYEDRDGKLHEHVVTFWHAVERVKYKVPVIIENADDMWDNLPSNLPDSFMKNLPLNSSWNLKLSLQQNEMFILGMDDESYSTAIREQDYATLSKYLYRVQNIGASDYSFRHHLETTVDDKYNGAKNLSLSIKMGKLIRIRSLGALSKTNPHKVRIDNIGRLTEV